MSDPTPRLIWREVRRIFAICLALSALPTATSSVAAAASPVFRCGAGDQMLTIFESTTSRLFQQPVAFSGPGVFDIVVETARFSFEAYFYARANELSKWRLVQKSASGQSQWRYQHTLVSGNVNFALLQLINDSKPCLNCTATMTLHTSLCGNIDQRFLGETTQ